MNADRRPRWAEEQGPAYRVRRVQDTNYHDPTAARHSSYVSPITKTTRSHRVPYPALLYMFPTSHPQVLCSIPISERLQNFQSADLPSSDITNAKRVEVSNYVKWMPDLLNNARSLKKSSWVSFDDRLSS
jgi:hypothetical protein